VEAYLKAGEPRAAIDCAVILNQWAVAVDLAQQFDYPQIEGLLAKQANALQVHFTRASRRTWSFESSWGGECERDTTDIATEIER
jgi:hypothetical protein